jgi:dTDP-4-amino-4,6-dideoxygalactose transaminase
MIFSKIKFLGLDRCFEEHQENLLDIYKTIGLTGQVVGGKHVSKFEDTCASISKRKYAVSVANATDGVFFALKALGIKEGDEVLTTSYSFHATAESILRTGATPVFVDVDDHYHIDLVEAEKHITTKTKAIVIVNLLGDCMALDLLQEFTNKHNLLLVEDAAQSLMAEWNGTPSGKYGVASVYSFAPSKNIPGFSHGGCVVTDNEIVYNKVKTMKLHGKDSSGHATLGYNSIVSSFEAGQINYFLTLSNEWQERRLNIAERYINGLQNVVKTPLTRDTTTHGWHKFVVRVSNRDGLKTHLNNNNIECGIHYNTLTPNEPLFNSSVRFKNAELLASESLSLPIYPELTNKEVDYIIKTICTFYQNVR